MARPTLRKGTRNGQFRKALPRDIQHILATWTAASAAARTAKADERAADVSPIIRELQAGGASLRQIAADLTARGIPTPRASEWTAMAVKRVVERSANV